MNDDLMTLRATVEREHAKGGAGDRFPAADILPLFAFIDAQEARISEILDWVRERQR